MSGVLTALLALYASSASAASLPHDFSWMRADAAVGNIQRPTIDQGVTPGTFRYVGSTGVSAMQMYLGTETTVYVVDKTERNDNLTIGGHPAWAVEIDLTSWTLRPLDIITNSFCAGGAVAGNGSLVNVGGNNAITTSGADVNTAGLGDAYHDQAGGKVIRTLTPCTDDSCNWLEEAEMRAQRWYPTLETLANGTVLIVGGELYGGYTNLANQQQNNPTLMVWPGGAELNMPFLSRTQPNNLYPLMWQLPDGLILTNAGYDVIALDPATMNEIPMQNLPHAIAVYPASAASAMLPLTPANNYTASILICGGVAQPNTDDAWDNSRTNITAYPGSQACSRMDYKNPSSTWVDDDNLLEGRIMGSMILLPDGTVFLANGVGQGTAGYGWYPQWIPNQQGYGSKPVHAPALYDPSKPAGQRWTRSGLGNAQFDRMYHSTALLLPDGAVLTAGSNPNADFIGQTAGGVRVNATDTYWTTYGAEKWYPSWYNQPRPQPQGIPMQINYGGNYFDVSLPTGTFNSTAQLSQTKFVLNRPGYSTHGIQMGMRQVELRTSITGNADGSAVLHVAGVPSPEILAPGPLLAFVVIQGVPSIGKMVMIGNSQFGVQNVQADQALPQTSSALTTTTSQSSSGAGSTSSPGATAANSNANNASTPGKSAASNVSALSVLSALSACLMIHFARR